jgi:hypothetical protein
VSVDHILRLCLVGSQYPFLLPCPPLFIVSNSSPSSFVVKSPNRKKPHGLISGLCGGWEPCRNWQLSKQFSVTPDRRKNALSNCSIGLAERAAHLLWRVSESGSIAVSQKQPLSNVCPGGSLLMKIASLTFKNTATMVLGGYRIHHPCPNLIRRYRPYLPIIAVLQKPRIAAGHTITEADSLLSFKHLEQLSMPVRFAHAAAPQLTHGEPNEIRNC